MKLIMLLILFISVIAYSIPKRGVTCYAKAGLGIYDKHGVHEGYGDTLYKASASAMADCRSQHPFIGCIPIPGCK